MVLLPGDRWISLPERVDEGDDLGASDRYHPVEFTYDLGNARIHRSSTRDIVYVPAS